MALSQVNQTFDPLADAEKLRKAMKGLGTDEKAIIDVLGRRPSHQRVEIVKAYKTSYGKDLTASLKSELSGDFLKTCLGLCVYLSEYDAQCLRAAVEGLGTDEDALIDIISTRNNQQILAIKNAYKTLYKRDLEADLKSDTSGYFERVLVSLLTANRIEDPQVSPDIVAKDAQDLYAAGEQKFGTEEAVFNRVLCARSLPHVAAVAVEYQRKFKKKLSSVIDSETSGSYCKLLKSILSFATDPAAHVASVLYDSMAGLGTNDRRLQRTVITQCEGDLQAIKAAFQRQYGKSLGQMIRGDTSKDYQKILLALIGE